MEKEKGGKGWGVKLAYLGKKRLFLAQIKIDTDQNPTFQILFHERNVF